MENNCDNVFDIVFDGLIECIDKGSSKFEIKNILCNEKVPFEYCVRAMSTLGKRLGYEALISIAMRNDCPVDVIESLFNTNDDTFASCLFDKMYHEKNDFELNRRLEMKLLEKEYGLGILKDYFIDDEDIQRNMLNGMITKDHIMSYLEEFIVNNVTIPDDCWKIVDNALNKVSESDFPKKSYPPFSCFSTDNGINRLKMNLDFMRKPFDESNLDEKLSDENINDTLLILKMAYNPSISDYAITQLLMKISNKDFLEDINKVIDSVKERREQWRSEHS